jgi:hypothetical protein
MNKFMQEITRAKARATRVYKKVRDVNHPDYQVCIAMLEKAEEEFQGFQTAVWEATAVLVRRGRLH